jgi:hypothetical protein
MRPFRFLLLVLAGLACGDGTGPVRAVEGVWLLAEYVDAGTVGTTTGTMTFDPDGTFATLGTVTYPGEPEDSLTTTGTWTQQRATVSLTADGQTGSWGITGSETRVTLRLLGQVLVTRIVLARPIR